MSENLKISPYGFREYDARWLYEKDINLEGMTNLGKGFGSQIIKHTKKINVLIFFISSSFFKIRDVCVCDLFSYGASFFLFHFGFPRSFQSSFSV